MEVLAVVGHKPSFANRSRMPGAAVRAALLIGVEDPLEQPRLADTVRPGLNLLDLAYVGNYDFGGLRLHLGSLRFHQRPQLRIRGQHPMKPNYVQRRPRHQRGQPLHEHSRCYHQVHGAIAPQRLELQLNLAGVVDMHPIVRERRLGDVAAQLVQLLAAVSFNLHGRVQAKASDVSAQRLAGRTPRGIAPLRVRTF